MGDTNILKLKKDQMNVPDKEGFVLLHYAVLDQRVEIIKILLDHKCGEFAIIIALYAWKLLEQLYIFWNAIVSMVKELLKQA